MKLIAIASIFIILQSTVSSTNLFPPPDYSNAIDAIFMPKYKTALKNMFPHIDFDAAANSKQSKIINGIEARLGDFPYQVLNYMTIDNVNWYTCGSVLIARQWVLTAGHCVFEFTHFELYFGTITRNTYGYKAVVTGSQKLHEKYDDDTLANDIALIFLADVPENFLNIANIGVVAMPTIKDVEINLVNKNATVSGFGRTVDNGATSSLLMFTSAPIMTNTQCELTFGPYVLSSNLCIDTRFGAGSSCRGDSGGPLTAEIETGRRTLVGIVSFGASAGCSLGYPDVYTRVTSYIDWIDERINPKQPGNNDCNCICNCFTCPA